MDTQWRISWGSDEVDLLFFKDPIEDSSCCAAEIIFKSVDFLFCFSAIHCGFEVILFCECYASLSEVLRLRGEGKRTVRKGCFAILVVVSDDICDTADGTVVKRVDESGYADVFEVPIFGTSG